MNILYYDCNSGISGDMNVGAMLELGVSFEILQNELSKLNLNDEFKISHKKVIKCGISATKFDVICTKKYTNPRTFREIKNIILNSSLSDFVKEKSIDIFKIIAGAEAKVHNMNLEDIHFHEIGAIDSIVDIVACGICLEQLQVDEIYSSHIELGGGVIQCEHGVLNAPAPATCEILKNIPISLGKTNFELTTPTGAAIIKSLVKNFNQIQNFEIQKIGYGAGKKDLNFPNLLRIMLCKKDTNQIYQTIIETNIDDMSGEDFSYVCEKLLSSGALDVFSNAIFMKKGRIGFKLSVLCNNEDIEKLKDIIFNHTSSIGTREYQIKKTELKREILQISTKYGKINVKVSKIDEKNYRIKPEFDDCKKAAINHNIPISKIKEEILNEYRKIRKS